jgi:hypothetical protein
MSKFDEVCKNSMQVEVRDVKYRYYQTCFKEGKTIGQLITEVNEENDTNFKKMIIEAVVIEPTQDS